MFCTNCGAPIEPGQKFCNKCGAPVNEADINVKGFDPQPQSETQQQSETQAQIPSQPQMILAGIPARAISSFRSFMATSPK